MAQPSREALTKFSGENFLLQPDGTLKCPAQKTLRPAERRKESEQIRIVYQAKAADCRDCDLAKACKISRDLNRGRRVSVLLPLSNAEIASSPLPHSNDKQKTTS